MPYKKPDFHRENKDYELTVFLMTYNQKDFIGEAMDSIIMQKVNFKYQLVVLDDYSTDGTFEILEEYAKKYDFIKIKRNLDRSENHYWFDFSIKIRKTIDTKYIALLDGDDYWIDDQKLQDQYDILESNQDCVVAYDSIYLHDTDHPFIHKDRLSDDTFWSQTGTTFYRNIIDLSLYHQDLLIDGAIYVIFSQYGKLAYRSNITAFYRKNSAGVSQGTSFKEQEDFHVDYMIMLLGFCFKNNLKNNFMDYMLYDHLSFMYNYMKHAENGKINPKYTNDKVLSVYIEEFQKNILGIFNNKISEYDRKRYK